MYNILKLFKSKQNKFIEETLFNLKHLKTHKKSVIFSLEKDNHLIISFGFDDCFFIFQKEKNQKINFEQIKISDDKNSFLEEKNNLIYTNTLNYFEILKTHGETVDSEHFLQKLFDIINNNRTYYHFSFHDIDTIFNHALENPYYDLRIISQEDNQNWLD